MNLMYSETGTPVMRLIEELSELQHALCKAERFGWDNCPPRFPDRSNRQYVASEMADVLVTMQRVVKEYNLGGIEVDFVAQDLPTATS